jgi:hypothetical protein
MLFNRLGYDYIDVTQYQTQLNIQLEGYLTAEILSVDYPGPLEIGVAWRPVGEDRIGLRQRHRTLFRSDELAPGRKRVLEFWDRKRGTVYLNTYPRGRSLYSHPVYNPYRSVQALVYADPLRANTYLLAWEGTGAWSRGSDRDYNDVVMRLTVYPAPEPATWWLMGASLSLIGAALWWRRRREARCDT